MTQLIKAEGGASSPPSASPAPGPSVPRPLDKTRKKKMSDEEILEKLRKRPKQTTTKKHTHIYRHTLTKVHLFTDGPKYQVDNYYYFASQTQIKSPD